MAAECRNPAYLCLVMVMVSWVLGHGQARILEVESGRDIHSKCSLMHIASDLTRLNMTRSFSLDELHGLPKASIPADLVIVGDGNDSIMSMGECTLGISVEAGVNLEVRSITLDMGVCALGLAQDHEVGGWAFSLGKGSNQFITRSTIILETEALGVLSHRLGKSILPGVPQTFTLTSVEESRSVTFTSVTFKTQDRGASSIVQHHPTVVKVRSTLDLAKLLEVRGTDRHTEAWIPEHLAGPCDHGLLLQPSNSIQPGTSLRIKPERHGVGLVDCPLDYVGPGVLEAFEYVSGEDLFLSTSGQFWYSGLQESVDLNWYWKQMFPLMLGDYSCRFVLKNSIIFSDSGHVNDWMQILKTHSQSRLVALRVLRELRHRPPYLKMDADGSSTLRIETLAWNGVCMENVTVTSDRLLVSSIFAHRSEDVGTLVNRQKLPAIVYLVMSLGILVVLACCCLGIWRCWPDKSNMDSEPEKLLMTSDDKHNVVPCTWTPLEVCIGNEEAESSRLSQETYSLSDGVTERERCWEVPDDGILVSDENDLATLGISYCEEWRGMPVDIKRIVLKNCLGQSALERQKNILEAATSPELMHENVRQTLTYRLNSTHAVGPPSDCHECPSQNKSSHSFDLMKSLSLDIAREHCDNGSLFTALRNKIFDDPVEGAMKVDTIVKLSLGIANGMEHLHRCGVVHGQLTSKNVLLRSHSGPLAACGVIPKIVNFGAHTLPSTTSEKQSGSDAGTSLCHFRNESAVFRRKSDVFSFGALLWEMFQQESACDGSRGHDHTLYPTFPGRCPMVYALLCITCLSPRPENRPDFSLASSALDCLMHKEESIEDPCAASMDASSIAMIDSMCGSEQLQLLIHLANRGSAHEDRISPITARGIQDDTSHNLKGSSEDSIMEKDCRLHGRYERHYDSVDHFRTGRMKRAIGDISVAGHFSESQADALQRGLSFQSQPHARWPHTSHCPSETASSNAFSVAIDDELHDNDSVQSAHGDLKFRWSPVILRDTSCLGDTDSIQCLLHGGKHEEYKGAAQEPTIRKIIASRASGERLCLETGTSFIGHRLLPTQRTMTYVPNHSDGSLGYMVEEQLAGGTCECTDSGASGDFEDISYEYTNPPVAPARPVYLSQNPIFIPYCMDTFEW